MRTGKHSLHTAMKGLTHDSLRETTCTNENELSRATCAADNNSGKNGNRFSATARGIAAIRIQKNSWLTPTYPCRKPPKRSTSGKNSGNVSGKNGKAAQVPNYTTTSEHTRLSAIGNHRKK